MKDSYSIGSQRAEAAQGIAAIQGALLVEDKDIGAANSIDAAGDAKPYETIEAGRGRRAVLLGLWHYRELLLILAWRDIKVRYKQTLLGAAWAVLQPFLTMVVFVIFFGKLAGISSDGIPYPIFAYSALLPWMFFSNAVTNASNSLVESAGLITKVFFPRAVIPAAAILAGLLDFAIASLLLIAMMAWYRIWPGAALAMLPVLVALTIAAAFAVGLWLSALNVKYRDVRYAIPFLVQIWLFLTPVIYPVSIVPAKWRWLLALNPMAGTIEGYRSALLGKPFAWTELAISATATIVFLLYATYTFSRMEGQFADMI
ncbi:MAG: ABC transporter permease [Candidatus Binatus sp.]|uniref:ABC transporter permease n=1 Tax=Candidatus Binatus sp. TaxID=2811406 RepID=UPI0027268F53|nr:ABC transporter permease [Candidatus Binatus sp.]MDO8431271.1 ABC transporter permease [Candidatus Binatus sp.]